MYSNAQERQEKSDICIDKTDKHACNQVLCSAGERSEDDCLNWCRAGWWVWGIAIKLL